MTNSSTEKTSGAAPITVLPPGVDQVDATRQLARDQERKTEDIIDRQTGRSRGK